MSGSTSSRELRPFWNSKLKSTYDKCEYPIKIGSYSGINESSSNSWFKATRVHFNKNSNSLLSTKASSKKRKRNSSTSNTSWRPFVSLPSGSIVSKETLCGDTTEPVRKKRRNGEQEKPTKKKTTKKKPTKKKSTEKKSSKKK